MTSTMRAIGLARYGSLDHLSPITVPLPEPGRGEIRVRVHAAAVNPADYKVCLGEVKLLHARNFPMVLGYDYSGVVDLVGAGTTDFKVGDAVFGFLPYSPFNKRGAFAELLIATAAEAALKPESVSHAQAAAGTDARAHRASKGCATSAGSPSEAAACSSRESRVASARPRSRSPGGSGRPSSASAPVAGSSSRRASAPTP